MARTQDIDNLDPHVSTAFAGIETLDRPQPEGAEDVEYP